MQSCNGDLLKNYKRFGVMNHSIGLNMKLNWVLSFSKVQHKDYGIRLGNICTKDMGIYLIINIVKLSENH